MTLLLLASLAWGQDTEAVKPAERARSDGQAPEDGGVGGFDEERVEQLAESGVKEAVKPAERARSDGQAPEDGVVGGFDEERVEQLAESGVKEASPWSASLHGDIKSFFTATFPYDHVIMPDDPNGQGIADFRLKLEAAYEDRIRLTVHHTATAFSGSDDAQGIGASSGVGLTAPEIVDLSWRAFTGSQDFSARGRIDRALLEASIGRVELSLGRQPITFGAGTFFTPLDLVNPFTPAVIDQEYKPGVDALRVDAYAGFSSQLSLVAAYAGGFDFDRMIFAAYGQTTVGWTDLGLFAGAIRGDIVGGASVVSAIGPVGVYGDVAVTVPQDDPVFVRGTVGALWRPTDKTTVTGEVYVQTLGETDPDEYFVLADDDRWRRGELWLFGVGYVGLAVSQEITPTLFASGAVMANVHDPSAFVAPSLAWSVASNVDVALGGFVGVGRRPDDIALEALLGEDGMPLPEDEFARSLGINSEFGTYPGAVFLQLKTYF